MSVSVETSVVVLVLVKDSHSFFVKTLTQSVACSVVTTWPAWKPKEARTKMVTVRTVLTPVEMTANPAESEPSQAEPWCAGGNIAFLILFVWVGT